MSLLSEHTEATTDLPEVPGALLPRVNLLPPELAEKARLRRLQGGLGAALLLTVGAITAVYVSASGEVAEASRSLEDANARAATLRTQSAQYADVEGVYAKAASARTTLAGALGQEVRYSEFLHELSRTVPDHIWLKQVSFTQTDPATEGQAAAPTSGGIGTVSFAGVGFAHDDVAEWLESLADQRGYEGAAFSDATVGLIGNRRTVSFTSTATLTADALSRRYTEDGD